MEMVIRPVGMKAIISIILSTYISVFTDEAQDRVYADEGSRATDSSTAMGDNGPRSVDVPHVGDKCEQVLGLCGCSMVWPPRVVQMSYKLGFTSLRK